jgi:hypothetical protein
MSLTVDQGILDEIRFIRAAREERFRKDMEEIDQQYDLHVDLVRSSDRLSMIAASLIAAAGLLFLVAAG